MSYDLFFRVPAGRPPISVGDFNAYFGNRRHYQLQQSQAWYSNEATGVYFSFNLTEGEEDSELAPGTADANVAFNLNFYRPHIFGLEAEPEVRAFVNHFKLLVSDPQTEGVGDGPYSTEGFFRGWNHGNEFGCRAVAGQQGDQETPVTLPTADLERYWRWNYGVEAYQQALGESIFVAKIIFLLHEGAARSLAVWPDGIPIALPDVDLVMLGRDELAPRSPLGKKQTEKALVPRSELVSLLRLGIRKETPAPHTVLDYDERPAPVTDFFKSFRASNAPLQGVGVDKILNREILRSR